MAGILVRKNTDIVTLNLPKYSTAHTHSALKLHHGIDASSQPFLVFHADRKSLAKCTTTSTSIHEALDAHEIQSPGRKSFI